MACSATIRPFLRGGARLLSALLCAGSLLAGPGWAAPWQDDGGAAETELQRVQRDQSRIGLRLGTLREKMERLAQRYEDEGRSRNATLLREALASFDERGLLSLAGELERNLERSSLSSVEQQGQLVDSLQELYALLRDRREVDELKRQADLARQGVSELSHLAENQRRLLAETRATSDRPGELVEQALNSAEALQRALSQAATALGELQGAEQELGEAELAESLAEAQAQLAEEAEPTAATQALLQEALAMLRERMAATSAASAPKAGTDPASTDPANGDPAASAAEADELSKAVAQARAEAEARAAAAAEKMTAARSQLEAAEAAAAAAAESAGGEGPEPPGDESGNEAGGESGAESPAEAAAAKALEAARTEMEAAAEELSEAAAALDRAERSSNAQRNRARALAQTASQDAAQDAAKLEELAQRLEAVEPAAGPELLDRTRQLLEELARLAKAAEQGQAQPGQAAAQAAERSIDELLAMLRARAAQGEADRPPPDAAQTAALAERQDELQKRLHELMERLAELPDQSFREGGQRAGQAMGGASGALRQGQSEEAAQSEEEAAEELEAARDTLAGTSQRYEQLRQEETLFRLGEELSALLTRHEAACLETRELHASLDEEQRLSRGQRRTVAKLADEERDLSTLSEGLRVKLEEDGAVAFTFALSRSRDDLADAADLLAGEELGPFTQSLQEDARRGLADLLAVLRQEQERRRGAPMEEQPAGSESPEGQPKPQLVPTVAELLLIQRMELAALARLDNFVRLNPSLGEDGDLAEFERELLDRWAGEHRQVSEMFSKMMQQAEGQQP
ncbi:MAG: hypothetical protein ACT4PU_00790 [Planctomycetota bacterium]